MDIILHWECSLSSRGLQLGGAGVTCVSIQLPVSTLQIRGTTCMKRGQTAVAAAPSAAVTLFFREKLIHEVSFFLR